MPDASGADGGTRVRALPSSAIHIPPALLAALSPAPFPHRPTNNPETGPAPASWADGLSSHLWDPGSRHWTSWTADGKLWLRCQGQTPRPPCPGQGIFRETWRKQPCGVSTNVVGLQPLAGEVTLPAPSEIPPRDSDQEDDRAEVMGRGCRWSEGRAAATRAGSRAGVQVRLGSRRQEMRASARPEHQVRGQRVQSQGGTAARGQGCSAP